MDVPHASEPTCPVCHREFETFRSYSNHYKHPSNREDHAGESPLVELVGSERLPALYRGRSEHEVADLLGVNQVTVHNALQTLGIDTTNPRHSEYPSLIQSQGYERITHKDWQLLHHRLLAVAWFGYDAVVDSIVHHKNGITWDNREENFEVMAQSDHIREHLGPDWGRNEVG